jgi:uncharacterized membrane protein
MNGLVLLTCVIALLFGVVAGLRAMTAPAVVSWGVHLGWFDVGRSWLGFFGHGWVRWLLTALALIELVTDQLPATPSRTVPIQFSGRVLAGGVSGAAVGAAAGLPFTGAVAGVIGAVIGTLGGRALRARLAGAFHNDRPAALIEDAVAIGGAILIGLAVP